MKGNGSMEKDKGLECKYGLMGRNMLENGKTIRQMDKEPYIMLMVMSMRVNGLMIKPVDKEPTHIKMALNMLENGKMTNKMVMVLNNGLMDKFTRDNTKMEQKLERAF